jgi:hypothetical protein
MVRYVDLCRRGLRAVCSDQGIHLVTIARIRCQQWSLYVVDVTQEGVSAAHSLDPFVDCHRRGQKTNRFFLKIGARAQDLLGVEWRTAQARDVDVAPDLQTVKRRTRASLKGRVLNHARS